MKNGEASSELKINPGGNISRKLVHGQIQYFWRKFVPLLHPLEIYNNMKLRNTRKGVMGGRRDSLQVWEKDIEFIHFPASLRVVSRFWLKCPCDILMKTKRNSDEPAGRIGSPLFPILSHEELNILDLNLVSFNFPTV